MLRRRGARPGDVHRGARVHVRLHAEVVSDADAAPRSAVGRRGTAGDGHGDVAATPTPCRADSMAAARNGRDARQADRGGGPPARRGVTGRGWKPQRSPERVESGARAVGLGANGVAVLAHVRGVGSSQRRCRSLARIGPVWRRRDHTARRRQPRESGTFRWARLGASRRWP